MKRLDSKRNRGQEEGTAGTDKHVSESWLEEREEDGENGGRNRGLEGGIEEGSRVGQEGDGSGRMLQEKEKVE